MPKVVLFIPGEEAIDRSIAARDYVDRLEKAVELERLHYEALETVEELAEEADSVAVLAGLSRLELESGYMEMEMDTIFQPQQLLGKLREALPTDVPLVGVVDDAYSDYLLKTYVRAGASAVVGTHGELFGAVLSRMSSWRELYPYLNVFSNV